MGSTFFVRKGKERSSIHLAVSYHGIERFTYAIPNSSVKVSEWVDGGMKVGRGKQDNSYIQRHLDDLKQSVDDFVREYQRVNKKRASKNSILNFIESGKKVSGYFQPQTVFEVAPLIKEIVNRRIEGKELNKGKHFGKGTLTNYNKTLDKLLEYGREVESKVTNLEIIEKDFILGFEEFLTNHKGYMLNTVGDHMKTLKSLIEVLVKQDNLPFNPFKKYDIQICREESDSIALDEKELQDLFDLDLSKEPRLELVRDQFLILCWTGLRISDFRRFLNLAKSDSVVVSLNNKKTGNVAHIPIFEPAKKILERYNGKAPRAISEQKMRDYIKEIGERVDGLKRKVEIKYTKGGVVKREEKHRYELLTLHVGRRTLATRLAEMQIPYHEIMLITGHRTLRTFEIYIKVNKKDVVSGLVDRVAKINELNGRDGKK